MKKYKISFISLLIAISLFSFSCDDKWDEHYTEGEIFDQSMMEYLRSNEELSTFVEILERTGYSDTLAILRAYTVFAPTNEALKNVKESDDIDMLKKLVGNHITNYSYTTSELGATGKILLMNNHKYVWFLPAAGGYTFGSKKIISPDVITKNGIVHVIENYYPYQYNIWEFIQSKEDIDSVRTYINSLSQLIFDREASFDKNNVLVDSVFKLGNKILTQLGPVNNELDFFTAILPTNKAWNEAYQKLFPYYKSVDHVVDNKNVANGDSLQIERTKWNIIRDFLFYGVQVPPTGKDSLISQSGTIFRNPDYLFEGATPYLMSNGYSYVTDKLNNKPEESWFGEVRVEAENDAYTLRTKTNCDLKAISSIGTSISASNNRFLRLENLSTSQLSKVSVTFPVPNTLAGLKYNVYCVFVPTTVIDLLDSRPYLLNFYLTYQTGITINNKGEYKKVTVDKKLTPAVSATDPDKVTKLLVAENVEFPYCDLLETSDYKNEINVFLKVENAATTTDERKGLYSRNIAIDCIILEPVIE